MLSNKSISFMGKHTIDKINNIDTKKTAKRLHMEEVLDTDIIHKAQTEMCNKL
jgi:hypothetical protein